MLLPLAADRETEIRRQLSEIPWVATSIGIEGGHISALSVRNPDPVAIDPDDAYTELADTVRIVGPTIGHPLRLNWKWLVEYTDGKRNEGSVHAAGCDYSIPDGNSDALSAAALDVQTRLRVQFETCG
ncbi:hypothetical protein JK358_37690 [Nocardia sp. 2]|uniref:Uncharacterized protein n=1 Tax=Nocardia acididurans TaxID=2802282 RepID=A0ABS1MHK4_9NOCA|nr:hypothetical protein [Nocardia acididurans]MBL1080143.1 hypothetical protein [Nocardia acididurans]